MEPVGSPPELRQRVARSILTRNLAVRAGENVVVEGWTHSLPWAVALAREARRLKAHPILIYEDEDAFWDSVEAKEDAVLGAAPKHEWAALGKTDVYVHLWGPGDRARLFDLGEKRSSRLTGWNESWYKVANRAGLRGARLELGRVHPTMASRYGVDEATWLDQVVQGTLADPPAMARAAAPLRLALEKGRELRVRDDAGTDLKLGLAKRKAVVMTARPMVGKGASPFSRLTNLPGGLVRVALDENVAEGRLVANRSSYTENGAATGAELTFSGGRLVDLKYATGGELFDGPYQKGGKGHDRPGLFSIGLNPGLHNTPQIEDIERGAVLVSVGGNKFVGGKNPAKNFTFAISAGASVEVDGRPLSLGG